MPSIRRVARQTPAAPAPRSRRAQQLTLLAFATTRTLIDPLQCNTQKFQRKAMPSIRRVARRDRAAHSVSHH